MGCGADIGWLCLLLGGLLLLLSRRCATSTSQVPHFATCGAYGELVWAELLGMPKFATAWAWLGLLVVEHALAVLLRLSWCSIGCGLFLLFVECCLDLLYLLLLLFVQVVCLSKLSLQLLDFCPLLEGVGGWRTELGPVELLELGERLRLGDRWCTRWSSVLRCW